MIKTDDPPTAERNKRHRQRASEAGAYAQRIQDREERADVLSVADDWRGLAGDVLADDIEAYDRMFHAFECREPLAKHS